MNNSDNGQKEGMIPSNEVLSQMLMNLDPSLLQDFGGLVSAFSGAAKTEQHQMSADWVKKWVSDKNSGGGFVLRLLSLHPNVLKKFVAQMMSNVFFRDHDIIGELEKEGLHPPVLMLISPTMRCNYKCKGCYAANYTRNDDMPFEVLDRTITEAKNEIGTKFFIILGGEPLVYRPLLDIFTKHNDVGFQFYTNGALIDKEMARKLVELGNIAPQISVEGFRKETDERRGVGAFDRAMRAMDNMKEAGGIFAFSVTVTTHNVDIVTSDEFIDLMIEKGAMYGWYFLYMPVSGDTDLSLMPTAEQRDKVRKAVNRFRSTKPILLIDFWNDAPLTGGCISGGRTYLHINHKGDVEPCIFCHYATHNINQSTLKEALHSPFFTYLRSKQPFSYNTLRPCPIIDHPHIMRRAIALTGAKPTHEGAENTYTILADQLDKYAVSIKDFYNPIFEKEYAHWATKWQTLLDFSKEQIKARKQEYLTESKQPLSEKNKVK
ncbi:MAG: radical SAM protein [Chloroflexi bacterium]|nr:radical SAM protein [Chloroflexota bacterium]